MRARYHGEPLTTAEQKTFKKAGPGDPPSFGFMFGGLSTDPANRLPEGQATIDALSQLGIAMAHDPSNDEGSIPAVYTYFGQFIDHDITKTVFDVSLQPPGGPDPIEAASFQPIAAADVVRLIQNGRTAPLDLDSLFLGLAEDTVLPDNKMALGVLSPGPFGTIPTADREHDLPRKPMIENPTTIEEQDADRQALIGDPRNDENLIVAQMHVAFLRAFNVLIGRGLQPEQAQRELRRRYQWAVLHDFLPRIGDREVVADVLANRPRFLRPDTDKQLFMPIEFAAAAYRFGHSMIRASYAYNGTFPVAGFDLLFTFTALSGDLHQNQGHQTENPTLPDNWVIEWHRFFDTAAQPASANPARRIDANLAPELALLRNSEGVPIANIMAQLAARNLLRGYLLGLPTGQAVARAIGAPVLPASVLQAATPTGLNQIIQDAGLLERTPLWFYILAEAGNPAGPNGQHLGAVGTRIIAETLWTMAKFAPDSVVLDPPTAAELASGEFTLKGIVNLGLDSKLPPVP